MMRMQHNQLASMPILHIGRVKEVVACGMIIYEGKSCLRIDTSPPPSFIRMADGAIEADARDRPDTLWIPEDEGSPGIIWGVSVVEKIKEIETECAELGIPFNR